MHELVTEIKALDAELATTSGTALIPIRLQLKSAIATLATASEALAAIHRADAARALAGAVPYLQLCGIVIGGWLMAKAALAAKRQLDRNEGERGFLEAKLATARFFAEQELAAASSLLLAILGGDTVMNFAIDAF
jgi:3-(methylsulfanyl)propanoyl-CoA dehydrogenase